MYPVDMLKVRDSTRTGDDVGRHTDGWTDEDASHQPRAFRDIHELYRQCPSHSFEGRRLQVAVEGTL
jgi:hypothetical protein